VKVDPKRIATRTISRSFDGWPRIFSAKYSAMPLGVGFGASRFSSPSKAFRVLYAAENFPTAFAEAVVRDRYEEKLRRYLYRGTIEAVVASEIRTQAALNLVDLTGSGAYELGIDTDTKGARAQSKGQAFAEALHATTTVDGVLFSSRLTGGLCAAIFDRGLPKLSAGAAVSLFQLAELANELNRLEIVVRKNRVIP
jgi:hypothetical protein